MLIVSVLAIYRGHYMAVLLGMVSGLCVTVATIWYVAPGADHVASTPASVRTQARSSQPGLAMDSLRWSPGGNLPLLAPATGNPVNGRTSRTLQA